MSDTRRNDHGKPIKTLAHDTGRGRRRSTDQTLGLLRGIVADGVLNNEEILTLARWLRANDEHACLWPFNVLTPRVLSALEDDEIDEDERADLQNIITKILGTAGHPSSDQTATAPPFTRPTPDVPDGIRPKNTVLCIPLQDRDPNETHWAESHAEPPVRVPIPPLKLTAREVEVLVMIANGKTVKEIAHQLGISTKTVASHRRSIMYGLNIRQVSGLVRYAIHHGLITA